MDVDGWFLVYSMMLRQLHLLCGVVAHVTVDPVEVLVLIGPEIKEIMEFLERYAENSQGNLTQIHPYHALFSPD
jgi:hypothetical protein